MRRIFVFAAAFMSLLPACLFSQDKIRVNQIGYCTNATKQAMLTDVYAGAVTVRNAEDNSVVAEIKNVSEPVRWDMSGEVVQWVDFSSVNKPGKYYLHVGNEVSYPFEIRTGGLYDDVLKWSLKSFYLWRASIDIKPEYATYKGVDFSRPAGHPDTEVYVHASAASKQVKEESVLSSPKGWYDAGDYNKYVVNAGISVHDLALAYELYPDFFKKLDLNIPESGNGVPDILDELMWEYEWLLTMQDPNDGGVYHKVSSLRFSGMVMPHEDLQKRYMIGKSTAAALDFAAVMAMASRIYAPYEKEFPGFSKKALDASLRAWKWAQKNPRSLYDNPKDVFTGSYADDDVKDEFYFAAAELFITTKDKKFLKKLDLDQSVGLPSWRFVAGSGLMSLIAHLDNLELNTAEKLKIEARVKEMCDGHCDLAKKSVGRFPLEKFEWGGNGMISTLGSFLAIAYKHFASNGEVIDRYKDGAVNCFDYLMGVNATGYCFLSGFGHKSPKNQHDRRNEGDGIDAPLPGYLSGGVSTVAFRDCGEDKYPVEFPAKCFLDETCSFSSNEIAINWNAPFVLLSAIMVNEYCR